MDKKKGRKNADDLKHLDLDTANAASSTDCTGLIPANPQGEAELESYSQVYETEADIVPKKPKK